MGAIRGEIITWLDLLGLNFGHPRIRDKAASVGADWASRIVEDLDFGCVKTRYVVLKDIGLDLCHEDRTLSAVFIRTQPDNQDAAYRVYPRREALIDGLSPTMTRVHVTALFGEAECTGPSFQRYVVNERYLHFEFSSNQRVSMMTAMLEAP